MYNIQVPGWVQYNEVHEESYVQYSGLRMGTVLEYMRNPMYNIQVPGWVQGWSTKEPTLS